VNPLPIITGAGLATPLGLTLPETWQALCGGAAIRHHARLTLPAQPAGRPGRFHDVTEAVAREAMESAGWANAAGAALVLGTSKGPVEDWMARGPNSDPPAGGSHPFDSANPLRGFGLSEPAAELARRIRVSGPRLTLSAACASGLHALIRAAMMIRSGETARVLVVAVECSVHPLFVGSFQRLGVLPPEGVGCRPFDRRRAGFLMSEAAAAVCVEALPGGSTDGTAIATRSVHVERFAFGGDATHLTGSDARARTLRHLLSSVVDGRPVDLVHAHGTGTEQNDPAELAAIESVLTESIARPPNLYSHKGALGHSLGAAGLVSVAVNWMCHREGFIPPNVNTADPLPTARVRLDRNGVRRPVRRSIVTASGFGGPTAVISLTTSAPSGS
jgi:3-oxoacyl-[acyl-carrier-protein] synthase II